MGTAILVRAGAPLPEEEFGALVGMAESQDFDIPQVAAMLEALPGCQYGDYCPLVHRFAPGVYAREITMPAGSIILGRIHKTRHLNIISKGVVSFWMKGECVQKVEAPYTFESDIGVQKLLYIHEETVWTTIHPTDETDLRVLESLLVESVEQSLHPAPTATLLPVATL